MRTKKFDKCIKNEMEEDIRKEQKKIREDVMELQQDVHEWKADIADNTRKIHINDTKHIPSNIQSRLIVIFSV
jgi:uncharacterized protein YlxW (UPF0749 family)